MRFHLVFTLIFGESDIIFNLKKRAVREVKERDGFKHKEIESEQALSPLVDKENDCCVDFLRRSFFLRASH